MDVQTESFLELKALISLLDEPGEENFEAIRSKIGAYGSEAVPYLRDACNEAINETHAHRIKELINEIYFNETFNVLSLWSDDEGKDLLAAFIAVSKILKPDLDVEKYLTEFEQINRDVWLELNDNLTALEKIRVLNHIIYDYYNFSGQRTPNGNKLNLYIFDHLLDKKKGNSLSLGILYLAIAQSLHIPVYGVDLPGHFILCYLDEAINLKPTEEYVQNEILFYLNAMNKGAVFTKNEVVNFVQKMNIKPEKSHFLPCSNKTIIKRLLREVSKEVKLSGDENTSRLLLNLVGAVQ
jgi:regulator of sirC expression with transglutaminase-like and TPR domain